MSMVAVIAIFLSNIPEGLSSASGMKKAGRSARYVFNYLKALRSLRLRRQMITQTVSG